MSPKAAGGSPLTPEAQGLLEAQVEDYRSRIMREALRLQSAQEILTSRDIVNASEAIEARRAPERMTFTPEGDSTFASTRARLVLQVGILLLTALNLGVLVITLATDTPRDPVSWVAFICLSLGLGVGIGFLALSASYARRIRYSEDRRVLFEVSNGTKVMAEPILLGGPQLDKDDEERNSRVEFLVMWQRVEDRVRDLARDLLGMPEEIVEDYPIGPLLDRLTGVGVLSEDVGGDIRSILQTRNQVAHGGRVSRGNLSSATKLMDSIDRFLASYIRSHKQ